MPGSTSYQVPHSSTTSATRFSGSYLSMTAPWPASSVSMKSALRSVTSYSSRVKSVALPLWFQSSEGVV